MKGKRIVIVGAGPGGLASAMLLASAGFDVKVIERLERPGGRTSTLRLDGFKFDMGPTFFLYPQVLQGIFAMCGRSLADEVELLPVDPHYRLTFEGGGELVATRDLAEMQRQVARLAPQDAAGLPGFVAENRAKLAAFRPILESPFLDYRAAFKLPLLDALSLLRPWASVDRDLKRYFSDPRIRLAFSFQSKYLGMSPFQCPSLFTILSFLEYEYGIFHPRGGCGAVSDAMARVARELGADIRLQEPVEEILFEGRRAVGVRTPRGTYRCDALVINSDFAHTMSHLVPNRLRRRWTDEKLKKKRYSCSTFMLYLGIEGRYDNLAHHTIHLAEDYRTNLDDIERHHVLSRNPSFYVQNPCVTDPSLAPAGMSTLYVLVPVTHQHANVDWAVEQSRFRALTLRQLAKLGLHDVEKRIRVERVLTPVDWAVDMNIYRGATFNLAHTLNQMLWFRPRNRFEDLQGVYLVGGGTHPGSGLPVIYESAKITSRLLAQDLGIEHEWKRLAATAPALGRAALAGS